MTTNAEKIGAGIVAVGGIIGVVWGKLQSLRVERATNRAEVSIADSQREVYDLMKERMTALSEQLNRLQSEVDTMREQLRARDSKIHSLELYVQDLQHVLHQHGIEVPPMRS